MEHTSFIQSSWHCLETAWSSSLETFKGMEGVTLPKATKATFNRLYNTKIGNVTGVKTQTTTEPEDNHAKSGVIVFGHSQNFERSPSDEELEAYRSGRVKSIPIRIVTYRKQGVPLPRTSSGQSHRGQCRNGSGGFYSA